MYLVVPPGGCFPEPRRIELGPGPLTIGRAQSCDIQVDVPGVDQEHAKISEVALVAIGADCAVGDVPLDPGSRRLVMPGDEIQIGSVVVALEGHDPSMVPPSPDGPPVAHAAPRVRVVEGANFGDELVLVQEGREYVLGRGPKCDLILDDREVSREHVKLMRRAYVIYVQDLSSTRGSWLGRSAVYSGSSIEWSRPRMLRVGATVLSLELPEAIRRAAPGAQASAPMTPPPRARDGSGALLSTPSAPNVARGNDNRTPAPSSPPIGSHAAAAVAAADAQVRRLGPLNYDPTPPPMHVPTTPSAPPVAPRAGAGSARALGPLPVPSTARKAWKKSGPTIGKVSGLLLLALAGLAILGALFVVFSLLE
ncbi:MAG: FHA domain-containing protein [Labilithrix sp.]|nr:FHA domain-containing protein [Labilithrix sp.]